MSAEVGLLVGSGRAESAHGATPRVSSSSGLWLVISTGGRTASIAGVGLGSGREGRASSAGVSPKKLGRASARIGRADMRVPDLNRLGLGPGRSAPCGWRSSSRGTPQPAPPHSSAGSTQHVHVAGHQVAILQRGALSAPQAAGTPHPVPCAVARTSSFGRNLGMNTAWYPHSHRSAPESLGRPLRSLPSRRALAGSREGSTRDQLDALFEFLISTTTTTLTTTTAPEKRRLKRKEFGKRLVRLCR